MQMYLSQDLVYPNILVGLPFPLSFHVSGSMEPLVLSLKVEESIFMLSKVTKNNPITWKNEQIVKPNWQPLETLCRFHLLFVLLMLLWEQASGKIIEHWKKKFIEHCSSIKVMQCPDLLSGWRYLEFPHTGTVYCS